MATINFEIQSPHHRPPEDPPRKFAVTLTVTKEVPLVDIHSQLQEHIWNNDLEQTMGDFPDWDEFRRLAPAQIIGWISRLAENHNMTFDELVYFDDCWKLSGPFDIEEVVEQPPHLAAVHG